MDIARHDSKKREKERARARQREREGESIESTWKKDKYLINQTRARDRICGIVIRPISVHSSSSGPTVVQVTRVQLKTSVKKKHTLIKGKKNVGGNE